MTGLTSAMIAYDMDTDEPHRATQPLFYGYIKDGRRGRTFFLMTMISALHNLSRSVGYAILAVVDLNLALKFFVGEVGFYLLYKIARRDFYWWLRLEGVLSVILSLLDRTLVKVITDFTGCIHLRHSLELGGLAYSSTMVWAQIFPFVALGWYEGGNKEQLQKLLISCFGVWLVLNGLFFCSIDRTFLRTFFTRKTGPQYICELFRTSTLDSAKFRTAFSKRRSFIAECEDEVKDWVRVNIERWRLEKPDWFKIDKIPDDILPAEVVAEEGGAKRRRSSIISVRSFVLKD